MTAVAIGGSIGGLTAAIKLKDIYETVYCFTGFNDYNESSNNGLSRGLRTVNLEDELIDVILEGWRFWESIGLHGDLIDEFIIHRFYEKTKYTFGAKHEELLEVLDNISPKKYKRKSFQLNETTVLEDTGIYKLQDIVSQLKGIEKSNGVIVLDLHVTDIFNNENTVQLKYRDSQMKTYELSCKYCLVSIGNEIKNVNTNLKFTIPLSIWNEFSYYNIDNTRIPNEFSYYSLHSTNCNYGIWTWGSIDYNTKNVYKDRLGFYVMMESHNVLKVACDTSFIKSRKDLSNENLKEYRYHKTKFVENVLKFKYSSVTHDDSSFCSKMR
jgi:hypothetical protein